MAGVSVVKAKGKWKKLKLDPSLFPKDGFSSFLSCVHVLTDYEIIQKTANKSKKKPDDEKPNKNVAKERQQNEKDINSKKSQKKSAKKIKNEAKPKEAVEANTGVGTKEDHAPAKKKKRKKSKKVGSAGKSSNNQPETSSTTRAEELKAENTHLFSKGMENWKELHVPPVVLKALKEQGFFNPTPIQAITLPHAIRDRLDIVGAAETGSGKTLAFGIPVLNKILSYKQQQSSLEDQVSSEMSHSEERDDTSDDGGENSDEDEDYGSDFDNPPTEEECYYVQKSNEIDDSDVLSDVISEESESRIAPLALVLQPTRELAIQCKKHLQAVARHTDIQIVSIVGGMAVQKQQRVLKRKPEVIVATPGRLWELVEQDDPYLKRIDEVHSLVVDEADRMVEKGHFEELTKLLELMNANTEARKKRQTFLFSATLTMALPGPQRTVSKKVKMTSDKKLEMLMKNIGMKERSKVVDLTHKTGTVEALTETRINCSLEDKDLYLYYFLSRYPGRTLVFTNSKDCIRRLSSIFTLLKCEPLSLHADMHQKQRLKNLERFTASQKALLLASDVAARGLDIPNVQHVIHYQVPQTVENYVHRSGRTARASKEGLSVVLIGPDDVRNYRKIMNTLNRNDDLPQFPIETEFLSTLRTHLNLAKTIDTKEHRFNKKKHQNDWFLKAAREMDMELEEDTLLNDMGDDFQQSRHKAEVKQLRYELGRVLQQSVKSRQFSAKYPTKTGRLLTHTTLQDSKDAVTEVKENQRSRKRKRNVCAMDSQCNTISKNQKQKRHRLKKRMKLK